MSNQCNCEIQYDEFKTTLRINIDLPIDSAATRKPDESSCEPDQPAEKSNTKKVGIVRRFLNWFDLSTRATVMDTIVELQKRIEHQERQLSRMTDYQRRSSKASPNS